jgi:hypothetical protein
MRILPIFSGCAGFVLFATVTSFSNEASLAPTACWSAPDTLEFCVELGNAELPPTNQYLIGEQNVMATSCSVHAWTTQEVSDPCGGTVTYSVILYPFSGPESVEVIKSRQVQSDIIGQAVLSFDTRENDLDPFHWMRVTGLPYTKVCDGTMSFDAFHLIEWEVINSCGDTSVITYLMDVYDCVRPKLFCVGLSSVVWPSSGSLTLWAKDFESGQSVDDCINNLDLIYSFSEHSYVPSRDFDCEDLCDGPSFLIDIWIADTGHDLDCDGLDGVLDSLDIEWSERNKEHCSTFIVIDDNVGTCDCVTGPHRITNPSGEGIALVRVDFIMDGDTVSTTITDGDGFYASPIINPLLPVEVVPSKNDDPKNGVSTLDLIKIHKHLLGTQLLDSPYELIAADANNSSSISALDLVEIRKLILGLIPEFSKNKSWRFIHEDYVFPQPGDPWAPPGFPGSTFINQDSFNGNFIGVKIGDVNGNAVAYINGQVEERRSNEILQLAVEDSHLRKGQSITVGVYASEEHSLEGLQLTFETVDLELINVSSGQLPLSMESVGIHHEALTMSIANKIPVNVAPGQPLFTLHFISQSDGLLSDRLKLSSDITAAEVYYSSPGLDHVETGDISLSFRSIDQKDIIHFIAPQPNPFSEKCTLGFVLADDQAVELYIYNIYGQRVYMDARNFGAGAHEFIVVKDELKQPGAFFYQISAGSSRQTGKLIFTTAD